MERLSEIYEEIKKPDKSKYYKNLIKKVKRNAGSWRMDHSFGEIFAYLFSSVFQWEKPPLFF